MQIIFVLVEPQVPENVGAAARALKTMGFSKMRVVSSDAHRQPPARWLAHGAGDIIDRIETFSSLDAAVADCALVVGTSAKLRSGHRQLYTPEQLAAKLPQAGAASVALVFGREDRGLSNRELESCELLTSIPLAVSYPSLNLGQAVMLYAYALSGVEAETRHIKPAKNANAQREALKQRLAAQLDSLNYDADSKLQQWALERVAGATAEDVRFLHSLCAALESRVGER
ncbi:tRNA/rRNA methyltransferase [Motiliproteus sediminis]|uniref:tRNA/rRNA methyltransferase n=1 Tax=Motiliproteus sediminis TaxID=1468178 RepID=UPI001AEF8392|nr:tRNA/rRNA methyltransferase [Motiliproteus sediminis]